MQRLVKGEVVASRRSTIFAQKGIPKMEQLSARLLLTAAILLLIAGGFSPFSKDGSIPAFSGRVRLDA